MEIKDVKRKFEKKNVRVNLGVTKEVSLWMKKEKVSPQLVFDLTIKDLMNKTKKN